MMHKIFLDTNIILDDILARYPFDKDAKRFFDKAENGQLDIFISTLSICNIAYILRKLKSQKDVISLLTDIKQLSSFLSIDDIVIEYALSSGYKDFEDAVQYNCALKTFGLTHFVTRNKPDFIETTLPILTPNEYWAL